MFDSSRYLKMCKVFREQNSTVAAAASSGSATFSLLLPWDPMPDCVKCDPHSNDSNSLNNALVSHARLEALKLRNEKTSFLASNPDLCYVLEQLALSVYPSCTTTTTTHFNLAQDISLTQTRYNATPREGYRGAFSRLSLSLCIGSLFSCQNAKGGFCVCDDHYEITGMCLASSPPPSPLSSLLSPSLYTILTSLAEESLQYYSFQSLHSPITYAPDPASVGRMLFSLTPVFESIFGGNTIQGPLDLKHWFGSDSVLHSLLFSSFFLLFCFTSLTHS